MSGSVALLGALALLSPGELAPDGHRGFGADIEVRRAATIARAREEVDEEFVAHLRGLSTRLATLEHAWRERLRAAGVFDEAGLGPEARIVELGRVWAERSPAAFAAARFDPFTASMQASSRTRLLCEELAEAELDVLDVKAGLALLLGHIEGWTDILQSEIPPIVTRLDLAAARLRARLVDLDALYKTNTQDEFEAGERSERLALSASDEERVRRRRLDAHLDRAQENEAAVRDLLALPRLDKKLRSELELRRRRIDMAATAEPSLRELCTETIEGRQASAEIQALRPQLRNGAVVEEGGTQLALDPFNERIVFVVALSEDFLRGNRTSLKFFDRYLALRGIRSARAETWRDRDLSADERRALDEVQEAERAALPPR